MSKQQFKNIIYISQKKPNLLKMVNIIPFVTSKLSLHFKEIQCTICNCREILPTLTVEIKYSY